MVVQDFKEACRLYWLVKGHLGADDKTIVESYDSYFKRLWNNNERQEYGMDGFEEAFKERLKTSKQT